MPDVEHYHTKVIRDRAPKLAPTLRSEVSLGKMPQPVTVPTQPTQMTPEVNSEKAIHSQFLSEYQSRMLNAAKPEFQ